MPSQIRGQRSTVSVLPSIKVESTPEGYRFSDRSASWGKLLLLAVLALAGTGISLALLLRAYHNGISADGVEMLLCSSAFALLLTVMLARHLLIARRLGPAALSVSRWPLRMGEELRLSYRRPVKGSAQVERVEAVLRCSEVASYRSGKSTTTERATIHALTLEPATHLPGSRSIEATWQLRLPIEGPASLAVKHNHIAWYLEVKVRLHGAPDDESQFELLVVPELAA